MSVPDAIHIYVATRMSPVADVGLRGLLDAFGAEDALTPTHWAKDERENRPYDRDTSRMMGLISANRDWFFCVKRSTPPCYLAYANALQALDRPGGLCHVKVTFESKIRQRDVAPIFRLGTELAANLKAEYGLVHSIWRLGERSQSYSAAGIVVPGELQPYGPPGVAARTWFGPHLTRLFGQDRLLNAGVPARETSWGGVEMELVERPWSADFEALSARQQAVMETLGPADVFARYDGIEARQGPNWVPIPETDP